MPSVGVMHILDSTSNKARPLTLASGVLSVNDSNARSSLASIDSKSSTINSSLSNIDSTLSSGTVSVSDSSAQSSLSNIDSSLSGTLSVSDSTAQSSLSNIDSSLTGTIATSTTLSITKNHTSVSNASAVVNGDLSSAHDCSNHRKVAIYGSTTDTSNNIEIHVSSDGSTYYKYGHLSLFPASDGSFSASFESPFTHIKLKYLGTATVTAIVSGMD